jgi:hypothetical protein
MYRLLAVKIRVLEIVWAYLYSGRAQDAWRSLAEMWPAADVERIRLALVKARERGICGQADGTSSGPSRSGKKHARIFDAINNSLLERKLAVIPPHAILLQRPPLPEMQPQDPPEVELLLVVDAAGKVRSAEPMGKVKVDQELLNAALAWKFIPAFNDGRAVTSRMRLAVSLRQ